ncbi:hypothetical protein [Cysteiniphilum sp. 6C5]
MVSSFVAGVIETLDEGQGAFGVKFLEEGFSVGLKPFSFLFCFNNFSDQKIR